MKYEVGDKIKIIRTTKGCYGAEGKIGTVTNEPSTNGLCDNEDGFNVDCGGHIWKIGFESECELLDELTAEEAIRLKSEMCEEMSCYNCGMGKSNNNMGVSCNELQKKYPERAVEILKQWKADHEKKKEVETEIVHLIRVMKEEGDSTTCMYAYEINEDKDDIDEKMDELVKKYCEENGNKIYAKCERICRVKS